MPNTKKMITNIASLVEKACKQETNYFGYAIWPTHIVHVVEYAKLMAKKTGADKEIVEIAALLHDYAGIKDYKLFREHHIYGARLAEEILKQYDYPIDKIEKVKECIISHSGEANRQVKRISIEAWCVADADAMAHFNAVGALYFLAYNSHKFNIEEANSWLMNKFERSWNKLSPEGKIMIKPKYEAANELLKNSY